MTSTGRVLVAAPRLLTGEADLAPGWVLLDGDRVADLGPGPPPGHPDLDLPAGLVAPGLVDAQVNGAFGIDLSSPRAEPGEPGPGDEGWQHVAAGLPATGVTAFVPTFLSAPVADLAAGLRDFAQRRPGLDALRGAARALGVHVEGPFLSPVRAGAHDARHLRDPSPEAVAELLAAGRDGALVYLTLAPERDGATAAVRALRAAGVRVSVGHSDASLEVVRAAADAGATMVTHLFNAQSGLHHRAPGVVGAALTDPRLTAGLVADGHHVHPAAVRLAFAAAPGRIMLVTDAVAALGMPPGRYLLGGQEVAVPAGGPPLRADGTVAGAAAGLDEVIGRAVAAGVGVRAAVEAATRVPAVALGRPDLGRIARGSRADLVWLAPGDPAAPGRSLRARATWVAGRLLGRPGAPEPGAAGRVGP